jgi:hypothetical protein
MRWNDEPGMQVKNASLNLKDMNEQEDGRRIQRTTHLRRVRPGTDHRSSASGLATASIVNDRLMWESLRRYAPSFPEANRPS